MNEYQKEQERRIEEHAKASGGRYYVYNMDNLKQFKGPFFPKDRKERVEIFVDQTLYEEGTWRGAYYRRLPVSVRQAIEEAK